MKGIQPAETVFKYLTFEGKYVHEWLTGKDDKRTPLLVKLPDGLYLRLANGKNLYQSIISIDKGAAFILTNPANGSRRLRIKPTTRLKLIETL